MNNMYNKFEKIKEFFLHNPGVLNEIGICEDLLSDPVMIFQEYELEELKETIGEDDFKRFVNDGEFDLSGWLKDHCFSEKEFVRWLSSLPEPDESELGEISVGKDGFPRENYPKRKENI